MCIHMCMYPALPPLALSLRNQKYIFRSTKDSALVVNAQGASIDLILELAEVWRLVIERKPSKTEPPPMPAFLFLVAGASAFAPPPVAQTASNWNITLQVFEGTLQARAPR